MNAIDDYWTENNRDTTRSCHRLNNRTTPKFMAFAIIQISRDNHHRNLQVLDVLGPQVSPQEITKALTIEQTRLRNLQLGEFRELTSGKKLLDLRRRIAIGKQGAH